MKKAIIVLAAVMVAMTATAVNRLYMPDFTIYPGETMQVALILENDEQFTAFQTDLILPEGLSVVQEEDEYLFDLTNRKASDHTIISKMRHDGAIRMVSFSIGVKPYSGSTGAIVVVNLTADVDFTGPATIMLKNSICANLDGVDFHLDRDSCEVSQSAQQLMGDADGDGRMNIDDVTSLIDYLLSGCLTSFHTQNVDFDGDGRVNIDDVTALIDMLLNGH